MANVIAAHTGFLKLDVAALTAEKPKTHGQVRHAFAAPLAPITKNLPVDVKPASTAPGVAAHATISDYYETIHVRPANIDVGRITSSVRREVEVWNAYRKDSRTLEQIDVTAGSGILVDGPDLPRVLGLLESIVFTVDVTPEGPATINARYDLVFSTPEKDPNWRIVGVRIIEWTAPPNWADTFDETWAFKTEILTSFDGSEQRMALRHRPRRTFAFSPLSADGRDRDVKRLLSTWQNRTYAMADWPRGVNTNGISAGGQSLLLWEPIEDLEVGGLLVLRNGDVSQVIEIAEIDGNLITLNSPVLTSMPPMTKAYRGLTVHADPSLSGRRLTSRVGRLSAQFREMHIAQTLAFGPREVTWRGLEAFLTKPNWARDVSLEHNWDVEWLDVGRGAFDYRTPHDAPKDIRKFTYVMRNRDEVRALRDFFFRCKGRRAEVFVPTWDEDLVYPRTDALGSGNAQLVIDDERDVNRMVSEKVYRNICVRLTDGTTILRHVIGGGTGPQGPALVLNAGWPRDIEAHEIVSIHWMPRCRLATDELTIRWLTDGVAEATLAFMTLEDTGEDLG